MGAAPDRLAAIAESDLRWPDYGDSVDFNRSGGFLAGAGHVESSPSDERPAETIAMEIFSDGDPDISLIGADLRLGCRVGVEWAREQIQAQ